MTSAVNPWDDAAYKELEKEANRDDRIGKKELTVSSVSDGNFPNSGDAYRKVVFEITGGGRCDVTFGEVPSAEEVKKESGGWDAKKKKAIASSIAMRRNLAKFYDGKTPETLEAGDVVSGEVVKNKQGFLRCVAFLAPGAHEAKGGSNGAAKSDDVPF